MGAYVASVPFARIKGTRKAWAAYMETIVPLLMRIFFAASIGFEIPPLVGGSVGWSFESFWLGLIFAIVAIVGKCSTGLYTYSKPKSLSNMLVLGTAMCGRGEFSFLIISLTSKAGIINVSDYAAIVVGLLLTTLIAPVLFITALKFSSNQPQEADMPEAMVEDRIFVDQSSIRGSFASVMGSYVSPRFDTQFSMINPTESRFGTQFSNVSGETSRFGTKFFNAGEKFGTFQS